MSLGATLKQFECADRFGFDVSPLAVSPIPGIYETYEPIVQKGYLKEHGGLMYLPTSIVGLIFNKNPREILRWTHLGCFKYVYQDPDTARTLIGYRVTDGEPTPMPPPPPITEEAKRTLALFGFRYPPTMTALERARLCRRINPRIHSNPEAAYLWLNTVSLIFGVSESVIRRWATLGCFGEVQRDPVTARIRILKAERLIQRHTSQDTLRAPKKRGRPANPKPPEKPKSKARVFGLLPRRSRNFAREVHQCDNCSQYIGYEIHKKTGEVTRTVNKCGCVASVKNFVERREV